jgi:hypothetical protein
MIEGVIEMPARQWMDLPQNAPRRYRFDGYRREPRQMAQGATGPRVGFEVNPEGQQVIEQAAGLLLGLLGWRGLGVLGLGAGVYSGRRHLGWWR